MKKDSPNKRVLMIAHCYPPCTSSGTLRTLKFSKYLPKFEWHSSILTLKCKYGDNIDQEMITEIPKTTRVYRCGIIDPIKLFIFIKDIFSSLKGDNSNYNSNIKPKDDINNQDSVLNSDGNTIGFRQRIINLFHRPDKFSGWLLSGIIKGVFIIWRDRINIIYSSSPPPTVHWIGYYLKLITGKKWVVDFRDPWTMQFPLEKSLNGKMIFSLKLEKKIVQKSDRIIANTPLLERAFLDKYGPEISDKLTVITNGFDPSDFNKDSQQRFNTTGKFLISHTGQFFENGQRIPDVFLKALSELIREQRVSKDEIDVIFLGGGVYVTLDRYNKLIEDIELGEVVRTFNHVPHRESLACLLQSDALLLLQTGEHFQTQIPAKTFEYLCALKPIIAITNPGSTAQILKEFEWCKIVDPNNIEDIKKVIIEVIDWKKNPKNRPKIDNNKIAKYSRLKITEELSKIFDNLTR